MVNEWMSPERIISRRARTKSTFRGVFDARDRTPTRATARIDAQKTHTTAPARDRPTASAMPIDFAHSGAGLNPIRHASIRDVAETAIALGFVREDARSDARVERRADVNGFFRMFSVNSLSNFKRVFARNALETPKVGGPVFVEERSVVRDEEVTWEVPAMEEYEQLAKNWDKEHVHKWRMLPKPGGAVCRPDDWYALHAAKQQAEKGDVQGEKPMWASHGGIAYDDRERWEFWNKLKGLSASEAKRKFLEAYGKAMLPERESLNFRKY